MKQSKIIVNIRKTHIFKYYMDFVLKIDVRFKIMYSQPTDTGNSVVTAGREGSQKLGGGGPRWRKEAHL